MKKAQNSEIFAEETNPLIKTENNQHFILLYESVYKNTKLTSDEIALIVKLTSASPTFKPTKNTLTSILHISDRALIKAAKGLKEKGYLQIINNGKGGSQWILTQEPKLYEQYKNQNKEKILNDFIIGSLSLPQLLEMRQKKIISNKDLNEILNQIAEILKTNIYK